MRPIENRESSGVIAAKMKKEDLKFTVYSKMIYNLINHDLIDEVVTNQIIRQFIPKGNDI